MIQFMESVKFSGWKVYSLSMTVKGSKLNCLIWRGCEYPIWALHIGAVYAAVQLYGHSASISPLQYLKGESVL